jgi:hypothetical protein
VAARLVRGATSRAAAAEATMARDKKDAVRAMAKLEAQVRAGRHRTRLRERERKRERKREGERERERERERENRVGSRGRLERCLRSNSPHDHIESGPGGLTREVETPFKPAPNATRWCHNRAVTV